jgi:glutathione S-transferase
MKLYDFPLAPNPRKLRVCLAEKGIEIPKVRVDLTRGEQNTPEFLAKNRTDGLPVLELDDGSCLRESLAIIEYLEELHPEPPMIGRAPFERARVRALERTADLGLLIGVARVFHAQPRDRLARAPRTLVRPFPHPSQRRRLSIAQRSTQ